MRAKLFKWNLRCRCGKFTPILGSISETLAWICGDVARHVSVFCTLRYEEKQYLVGNLFTVFSVIPRFNVENQYSVHLFLCSF